MKKEELPEDARELNNRYGKRFPLEQGYYGYIVSQQPALHVWQMTKYTIDVYRNVDGREQFQTSFIAEHGHF